MRGLGDASTVRSNNVKWPSVDMLDALSPTTGDVAGLPVAADVRQDIFLC